MPPQPAKFSFSPMNTSNYFEAGHRIRIEISSSNFPRFDRNLNTGDPCGSEMKVARNTVFHDKARASHLVLPVLPSNPSVP